MSAFTIFTISVTLLDSGFLIDDGTYVFNYHDLVKEAGVLDVKFPNKDDIEAEAMFLDPASNSPSKGQVRGIAMLRTQDPSAR